MDHGRFAHYRAFYDGPASKAPIALVMGNCQAESVRVMLATSKSFPCTLVRVPPVHELVSNDMDHLDALLKRTEILLTQSVRSDYRGLPVGTAQLAERLPSSARTVRWPVVRYGGLHPFTAIVRHPDDRSGVPPVVPYHDLRLISRLAGRPSDVHTGPSADEVVAVAEMSKAEMRRRERATADVAVSDLLVRAGADAMRTPNHPGNSVLLGLARRLQRALDLPGDATDPGRPLLNDIHAPLSERVITALGLKAAIRSTWSMAGEPVEEHFLWKEHTRWYERHPQWVEAGISRHRDQMALLGL
ncbi:WcbI family polysaccharide biosynthesis putative acetyltransferase [Amycolatopsis sp. lyj-90]|uniref:WcbI family polysaccharide biosynthesis putative acetyltransferase n=1 Tax=Amycolatopsis sp. lyj-90 TaxID=2789285 RepID=UPI00397B1FF3